MLVGFTTDMLAQLIFAISTTAVAALTGLASYIFVAHFLHSTYGFNASIIFSILTWYVLRFFTSIFSDTYTKRAASRPALTCSFLVSLSLHVEWMPVLFASPLTWIRKSCTVLRCIRPFPIESPRGPRRVQSLACLAEQSAEQRPDRLAGRGRRMQAEQPECFNHPDNIVKSVNINRAMLVPWLSLSLSLILVRPLPPLPLHPFPVLSVHRARPAELLPVGPFPLDWSRPAWALIGQSVMLWILSWLGGGACVRRVWCDVSLQ